jgi:hypothetical protein
MEFVRVGQYHLHVSEVAIDVFGEEDLSDTADLIAEHRRALADNPHDSITRFCLGNVLRIEGQLSQARLEYIQVVQSGNLHYAPLAAAILADIEGRDDHSPPVSLKFLYRLPLPNAPASAVLTPDPMPAIAFWHAALDFHTLRWVVFEYGTCVVIDSEVENPQHYAQGILSTWGPVAPGASSGDFVVKTLSDQRGWIVTYQHLNIFNFVHPSEVAGLDVRLISDMNERALGQLHATIGILGRQKRHHDSQSLRIIYIHTP